MLLAEVGRGAWALVGLAAVAWVAIQVGGALSLVLAPLLIALFPAALLSPIVEALERRRVPPALAAIGVLGLAVGASAGSIAVLTRLVVSELGGVTQQVTEGYSELREVIDEQVGFRLPPLDELHEQARGWALGGDGAAGGMALSAARTTLELVTGTLLALVALFFYLKDGRRLVGWGISLLPVTARRDAAVVADRVWDTLGAYFRGQLVVAAVDAVLIGVGLVLLGVPLAVPIALIVFFGGLFPVVGAFTAGAIAVLVALADQGPLVALAVLALNVGVQQAEGNLLEPLIVGRATQLHPLAVLVALTAGAVLLGLLGAFLAVPVVASVYAGFRYFRDGDVGDDGATALPAAAGG